SPAGGGSEARQPAEPKRSRPDRLELPTALAQARAPPGQQAGTDRNRGGPERDPGPPEDSQELAVDRARGGREQHGDRDRDREGPGVRDPRSVPPEPDGDCR